jgi:PAS domain S-box-containing protein
MATRDPDDAGSGNGDEAQHGNFAQPGREADARRAELVANAGHELKTPLSIILGLSGRLLATTADDSGQHRDVERIRSNAYALLKHVDALLQTARIDAGRAVVEPVDCDVAALVRDTALGFQRLLDEHERRLVLRTPGRLPARVDETKLGTVLSNLVANAVRYAPRGGVVRCGVAVTGRELLLEVADSGPGIPPAERLAVFERFHQIGGTLHRRTGGTGLGLAIVRELVTLMGGTVAVADAPEGGALFTVRLAYVPAVVAPSAARRAPAVDPAERERATIEALKLELEAMDRVGARPPRRAAAGALPRVLLVEPIATLGQYLDELLSADYEVRRATTAEEAGRIAAETQVDAVIVDVADPEGDALLSAVRTGALAAVPLVVLARDPEQAQLLIRGRADDYAVKPFAETLPVRLGSVVGRRRAESARDVADARFRAVFEHAPTGMALASPDGRLLEVNAALARLLGLSRAAPLELTLDDVTHPDDLLSGPRSLLPAARDDAVLRFERRLVASDGRVLDAVLTIAVIREGAAPHQVVVQVEESERRRHEARVLLPVLTTQLARCVRYDERAALLVVDVEELGSGEAATRLRTAAAVAGAMLHRLRRSDALVRHGDCRFAAVLADVPASEAMAVARSLQRALRDVTIVGHGPLQATLGVCAFDGSASPARIVADAERALRRARDEGRGGVAAAEA